jgi:hypothetical protein
MQNPRPAPSPETPQPTRSGWTRPGFELISLDCEITAYAPDGDLPLF